jgi:hypothetical protein
VYEIYFYISKNRNMGNIEIFEVVANNLEILITHMKGSWNKY